MEREEQLSWKTIIRQAAIELGFAAIGFTGSEPVQGLKEFLAKRKERGYSTPFEEKELLRRVSPKEIWPLCETVVVLAYPFPYTAPPQVSEGVLARSAVGEDYHRVVKAQLQALADRLLDEGWNYELPHIQVDTGPLNERAFAARAGIGWLGRNQQLIVPNAGSFVALGLLILDQKLPTDQPLENQCGSCQKCVEACPAQILGMPDFAANQCLAYLTQSKDVLTEEQAARMDKQIFGCDVCQEACPHNQEWLRREASAQAKPFRGVGLEEILRLTKQEFNAKYKGSAAGWRGKGILQRNAYLALKKLADPRLEKWQEERGKEDIPALIQPYIERE